MIESNYFLIWACLFSVKAFGHISLLECWIMDDILRDNQIGGLGLQIGLVYTIFKFVSVLSPLLMVANLALVEQCPLTAVLCLIRI